MGGKFWKNECFSGQIWPDWGNTAWADMDGLGSIGLDICGYSFLASFKRVPDSLGRISLQHIIR